VWALLPHSSWSLSRRRIGGEELLESGGRLSIEEPEAREWTMMAAINIGVLIEYGRPQGVLRRVDVLGQLDRNPGAAAAATKVKLARKAHTDEKLEVDGDERRRSSDMCGGSSTTTRDGGRSDAEVRSVPGPAQTHSLHQ
jgi:hypothetical protein